jgi:uncharacterized protein
MNCPVCGEPFSVEILEDQEILACRGCGGMWLHRHQLNKLLKESGGDVELCSFNTHPREDRHGEIKCLECPDTLMRKINFLDYSDIVLDRCPSCGSLWLDSGELTNMHGYVTRVDKGSHTVKDFTAYNLLVRLSKIAYSIFH